MFIINHTHINPNPFFLINHHCHNPFFLMNPDQKCPWSKKNPQQSRLQQKFSSISQGLVTVIRSDFDTRHDWHQEWHLKRHKSQYFNHRTHTPGFVQFNSGTYSNQNYDRKPHHSFGGTPLGDKNPPVGLGLMWFQENILIFMVHSVGNCSLIGVSQKR